MSSSGEALGSSGTPDSRVLLPPLVSIIIPCFNAERYVGEAIESALSQTYCRCEVIVVDDGSTDLSREVIEGYARRVQLETISNSGAPVARNRGLELAKGELVKFLDADDVLLPHAVETQVAALAGLPTHAIPFGLVRDLETGEIVKDKVRTGRGTGFDEMVLACYSGDVLISAPLHRIERLRAVGGFDPRLRRGQEWNLHLRLALDGVLFVFVESPIFLRRRHEGPDRISVRARGIAGAEAEKARCMRSAEAIAARYVEDIPNGLRERVSMNFDAVGRSFARLGQRGDAEEMFALARQIGGASPEFGRLVTRLTRRLLGPYHAERLRVRLRARHLRKDNKGRGSE